jgi:hypothetical protein
MNRLQKLENGATFPKILVKAAVGVVISVDSMDIG